MSNTHTITYFKRMGLVGDMEYAAILDIGSGTDPDPVHMCDRGLYLGLDCGQEKRKGSPDHILIDDDRFCCRSIYR